jgi:hypothetical protein
MAGRSSTACDASDPVFAARLPAEPASAAQGTNLRRRC